MSTNSNTFYVGYDTEKQNFSFFFVYCEISGLILQGGYDRWVNIRIFGVLQRLALCYFFAAILVLIFDDKEDEPYKVQWPTGSRILFKKLNLLICL
jgi:hypothetical protein